MKAKVMVDKARLFEIDTDGKWIGIEANGRALFLERPGRLRQVRLGLSLALVALRVLIAAVKP